MSAENDTSGYNTFERSTPYQPCQGQHLSRPEPADHYYPVLIGRGKLAVITHNMQVINIVQARGWHSNTFCTPNCDRGQNIGQLST